MIGSPRRWRSVAGQMKIDLRPRVDGLGGAMMSLRLLRWVLGGTAGLLAATLGGAATWRTVSGETFEGEIGSVHGPLVVFTAKEGTRRISVEGLDDAGVARVADFLTAEKPGQSWATSNSPLAEALRGRLEIVRDGKLVPYQPGAEPESELYVVIFGASENTGTQRYLPELVKRYRESKGSRGVSFEVLYHSRDSESRQHAKYAVATQMPWPCIKLRSVGGLKLMERWAMFTVPGLIVLNRKGDVVLDSEARDQEGLLMSPVQLWDRFMATRALFSSESTQTKLAMHRLALLLYLRKHTTGSHPPQPYALVLDRDRYQTVEPKQFTAKLELDERGRVAGATFEPTLGAVVEAQLTEDLRAWRFMPAIREGKPVPITVNLPVNF